MNWTGDNWTGEQSGMEMENNCDFLAAGGLEDVCRS